MSKGRQAVLHPQRRGLPEPALPLGGSVFVLSLQVMQPLVTRMFPAKKLNGN